MKAIIDALDAKFSAASPFKVAMVGGCWHMQADQNNLQWPYLVYHIITSPEQRSFGAITHTPLIQFDIWAKTSDPLWDTYEAMLYALLQGATLTPADHDRGVVLFEQRGVSSVVEDAIRIMDEATISGTDF